MSIFHGDFQLQTIMGRVSYHDISEQIKEIVSKSDIKDGIITISSAHTTCSMFFDETMHDVNYFGDDFLHVDINNVMDKIVPKMTSENQYNSPGPKHIEFGLSLSDPNYPAHKWTMLNTDAHIRSSMFGSPSLTFIIKDSQILLGALGKVYFVDWDHLRERTRNVNVIVMGEK
ncbi:MAG: secondary thiamine-phosphate synthase [Epulopiscium sp. Nele67-Bin002]|nr:MAG: secondary thiamine-phosphate synthase [Epulopiscium sp. Nele67-Bin002]OON92766.1 MAG: secondary thiamine-phosphate synthase [Epulopiscium sp. Nele67-Bin001]